MLGQNGSGKSTLLNVLMGLSGYKVTKGKIYFMGEDITEMNISDRANLGMGIMFQKAPSIQGLKLKTLIKTAFGKEKDAIDINNASEKSNMKEFLDRDVNVGFSGGEMKRCELLQLNLQDPEFIMLDEPESGVDLENMKLVGDSIRNIIHRSEKTRSALVITHTGHILSYLNASISHIMLNGRINQCGDATECLKVIQESGYGECLRKLGKIHDKDSTFVDIDHVAKKTKINEECANPEKLCTCGRFPGKACLCGKQRCNGCMCQSNRVVENTTLTDKNSKKVTINVLDDDLDCPSSLMNDMDSLSTSLPQIKTKEIEKVKVSLDDPSLFNGEYRQVNNDSVSTVASNEEGIEVLKLPEAISKYPDFKEKYLWRNIKYDKDDYTKAVYEHEKICYNGYVIIAHEGAKNLKPVKAQLLMEQISVQYVHNILIAKKGSCLSVSSFCGYCKKRDDISEAFNGQHYGISEFYVEEDAQLSFSMIHNYCLNYTVYPRSASRVEKNGTFISSYVCLDPVNKVQMNPTAYLVGENAVARFSSILMGHEGGVLDIGSTAFLQGPGSSSESITRALTKGGTIIASGRIVSESPKTTGHIECQGMVLKKGIIRSIPAIEGGYDCELSHEAAVGKIAQEKVDYLMSRGIKEDDAISIIIRGFLDVRIKGIPQILQEEIDYVMEEAAKGF